MPHSYTSSSGSRHGTVTSMTFNQFESQTLPSVVSPISAVESHKKSAFVEFSDKILSPILLNEVESYKSLQKPAKQTATGASRFTRSNTQTRDPALQSRFQFQLQRQDPKAAGSSVSAASRFARRPSVQSRDSTSATPTPSAGSVTGTSHFPRRSSVQSNGSLSSSGSASHLEAKFREKYNLPPREQSSQQATVESCASGSSPSRTVKAQREEEPAQVYIPSSPPTFAPHPDIDLPEPLVEPTLASLVNDESIVRPSNPSSFAKDESLLELTTYKHPPVEAFSPPLSDCSDYSLFSQPPDAKSTPVRVHRFRSQPKLSPSKLYPLTHGKGTVAPGAMDFIAAERTSDTIASRHHRTLGNIEVSQDEQDIYEQLQTLQDRNYELEVQAKTITDIFKTKLAESRADVALKARVIEENARVIEEQLLKIAEKDNFLIQRTRMIDIRDNSITKLEQRLSSSDATIEALQKDVSSLQQSNTELDREIVSLMEQRDSTAAFVANVTERDAKEAQIIELQKLAEAKDAQINKLQSIIDAKESAASDQNAQLRQLEQNLQSQHAAAAAKTAHINKLKHIVADIDANAKQLLGEQQREAESKLNASASMLNRKLKEAEHKLALSETRSHNLETKLQDTEHALSSSTELVTNLKTQLAAEHHPANDSYDLPCPNLDSEWTGQYQLSRHASNPPRPSLQEPQRIGQYILSRNQPIAPTQTKIRGEAHSGHARHNVGVSRTASNRKSPPPTYEEDTTMRPVQSPTANCQHLIDVFSAQLAIKKEYFEVSSRAYLSHNAGNRRTARQHLKTRIDETGKEIETLSEYIYILQDVLYAGV